jgi:hypothetical protein
MTTPELGDVKVIPKGQHITNGHRRHFPAGLRF